MSRGVPPWVYFIWYSLHFLDLSEWFLSHVREVFGYYLWNISSVPFSLSSPSGTPIIQMLVCLMLSQNSLRLSSFLFNLFYLLFCISDFQQSVFHLAVCSSDSCILLLVASNEFFISGIVFCISAYLIL